MSEAMIIEWVEIKSLKENPDNPRTISEDQFKKLCKSLEEFPAMLELRPIIVKDDLTVIGGNMRLKACHVVGLKKVPIIKASGYTPEQIRQFIIKDNLSYGAWDMDLLGAQYDLPELQDWGLELPSLDALDGYDRIDNEAKEDDYEIPEEIKTNIKYGDIYRIGNHRLMCGDSTKIEDVERLMDGKKADMVFTDPPYGVSYADKNKFLNLQDKGNKNQTEILNDHMTIDETSEFIFNAFCRLKESLAERSSYYITAPQGGDLLMMMMMMMQKAGLTLRHCLIWVKNNHVLGRCDYNYKHEPILFGWNKVHDFYGKGSQKFSTWEIAKPLKNDLHPTMKPVALIENACLNSTLEGDRVLDLFLGSGSTMVACHQLKRVCYGMELEPKYCQVIIDRMKKLDPDIEIAKLS